MAKWGEGDPRWIVEERPDATNVNNWHWSEKNATPWSKQRLKELLERLDIDTPTASFRTLEITQLDGEATANNRKAKLIFLYEWEIKLNWQGNFKNSKDKFDGSIEIPNLSDENGADEIDINVSAKSNETEALQLKDILRHHALAVIRTQLAKYIKELKEEFSQGLILPTKETVLNPDYDKVPPVMQIEKMNFGESPKTKPFPMSSHVVNTNGVPILTKQLELSEDFKCTAQDLYNALTIPEMVKAYTGSSSFVEPANGGHFSLFGGTVEGQFLELVPFQRIAMKWRMKNWPSAHFSAVTLHVVEKEDFTQLLLVQTDVPQSDSGRTEDGWRRHYFEALKSTFGFGARLF